MGVELSLQRSETAENKWLYDQLFPIKDEIEQTFRAELDWKQMDDKKSSRIKCPKPLDWFNKEI